MRHSSVVLFVWLSLASVVSGQTVYGDRFTLKTGPCTIRSGAGSPEGAVTGNVCDTYWRTSDGAIWRKTSGTGNTGWTVDPVFGTKTANYGLFGPTSGAAAVPTFRAQVLADLPTDSAGKVLVSGTAASWSASPSLTSIGGAADLTFNPTGDVVLAPTGLDVLPDTGYSKNLGSLTKKYLTLHAAELWVETLVAQNTIATIGGRILVGPTTVLTSDLAAGDATILVKHNQMAGGDRVYLEANGKVEFIAIATGPYGTGPYSYTVTRNLDGSGANDWNAGDAVFNTGTTGNGFMDLYSVRGVKAATEYGPTIVGNVRASATYNDWAPRWAIGNLDGLYGYSGTTYGAAFGVPTAAWIKIDPTNGVRMGHNATTFVNITADGSASFAGSLDVGMVTDNLIGNPGAEGASTSGWMVTEGTGTFNTTADWLPYEGGYNFRVGNGSQTVGAGYRAIPVTPGRLYSVRFAVKGSGATANGLHVVMNEKATYPSSGWVTQVERASYSYMAGLANSPIPAAWTVYEYAYTVPAGIKWVTLEIYQNNSGQELYFDAVDVRPQLRNVHIQDGVITAEKLVANTITSTQLSATAIDGMTITGATLQTASGTGARIVMNASNYKTYNSSNVNLLTIDGSTVSIVPASSTDYFYTISDLSRGYTFDQGDTSIYNGLFGSTSHTVSVQAQTKHGTGAAAATSLIAKAANGDGSGAVHADWAVRAAPTNGATLSTSLVVGYAKAYEFEIGDGTATDWVTTKAVLSDFGYGTSYVGIGSDSYTTNGDFRLLWGGTSGGDGDTWLNAKGASSVLHFHINNVEKATLNANGTQTWAAYGAGAATFDASGNITSVSDARFKDRVSPLPYGLAEVLRLKPVQHGYNVLSGLERDHLYGGFLAQDVQAVMPIAVGVDGRGYFTLADRPILGAVVNAIRELDAKVAALQNEVASLKASGPKQ